MAITETITCDISAQRLKSFIERIERLEEEKSTGFDAKIMRQVVKLRKMDANDRQEEEALLQVYLDAVGF
jgi:uncharacterized protein (UPF0335 family)